MASPTYLQLVNDVLIRLRENEVTAVTDNAYSKLIGKFVNDSKRQVEDAYNWNALCDSITVSTNAFIFNYSLLDSGQRFRIIDVLNDTNDNTLKLKTTTDMNQYFLTGFEKGMPQYYNFNGVDSNGDTQVDVYPIPDTSYTLRFNIVKPTAPLSSNSDTLLVPSEPVIFGAIARAIAERGEDGGIASNEQYALFKQSLGDAIALESGRYLEEDSWIAP